MRPVVAYDDISLPYQATDSAPTPLSSTSKSARPTKKRKRGSNQSQHRPGVSVQHWDDPISHGEVDGVNDASDYENGEESRELTHEEIWDDSALIEAWNAANEQYEVFHGDAKAWKKEPIHKSPLWYNIPPSSKKANGIDATKVKETGPSHDADSKPLNFETFVPTHDPSLISELEEEDGGHDEEEHSVPAPPGQMVSQDEAFERALGAMYWAGYWTAVYHCQRDAKETVSMPEEETGVENDEADEAFISTQRQ